MPNFLLFHYVFCIILGLDCLPQLLFPEKKPAHTIQQKMQTQPPLRLNPAKRNVILP